MLTAKLFAAFSILVGVFAFLFDGRTRAAIDVYLHDVYIVVVPKHLQFAAGVACAVFAVAYFCTAKWLARPLNNTLGVAHFVSLALGVILIAVAVKAVSSAAALNSSDVRIWHFLVLYGGIFSLLLSCLIFVVNLGWSVAGSLRAH